MTCQSRIYDEMGRPITYGTEKVAKPRVVVVPTVDRSVRTTCPLPVFRVVFGGNPFSPSDSHAVPEAPVDRFSHVTSEPTMQPHPSYFPPEMVTIPGRSSSTATHLDGGTSKLPFGFPNDAGSIWNGTVAAAEAIPAVAEAEMPSAIVQAPRARKRFMGFLGSVSPERSCEAYAPTTVNGWVSLPRRRSSWVLCRVTGSPRRSSVLFRRSAEGSVHLCARAKGNS
jgi:hypothetical protein